METNDNPLSTDKLDGFYGLEVFDTKGRAVVHVLRGDCPDDLAFAFRSAVDKARQKRGYGWRLIRRDTSEVLDDESVFGPTQWGVRSGWYIPGRENEWVSRIDN